jgi:hypothetical protein
MTHGKKIVGMALATAAAALFIAATGVGNADTGSPNVVKAKCFGGNACKGQSECKTTTNACKGLNACKGEGFTLHGACERPGRA